MADVEKYGEHLSEEQLVWRYYGEDDGESSVDLHLTLCKKCAADFEALKQAMVSIDAMAVPERGRDYGERVWRGLVQKNAAIASRRPQWFEWLRPRRLAVIGAMAAVLVATFVAGRFSRQIEPMDLAASPAVARERILAAALREHLQESERVLLEISNSDGHESGLKWERQRAENLLSANRLYRLTAQREGKVALAGVLEELERVLLDVAHEPENVPDGEAGRLRARVEDQGLLFKIRFLELRLQELENRPVPKSGNAAMKG